MILSFHRRRLSRLRKLPRLRYERGRDNCEPVNNSDRFPAATPNLRMPAAYFAQAHEIAEAGRASETPSGRFYRIQPRSRSTKCLQPPARCPVPVVLAHNRDALHPEISVPAVIAGSASGLRRLTRPAKFAARNEVVAHFGPN